MLHSTEQLLRDALLSEAIRFEPHDGYSMRTSPRFWRGVFERVHGEAPRGDDDPRWSELFKVGFPMLRKLLDTS